MLSENLIQQVISKLPDITGSKVKFLSYRNAGGGCINQSYILDTTAGKFFLKTNHAPFSADMFEKEMAGLVALAETGELAVPRPLFTGISENTAFLLLEYIESSGAIKNFWEVFGISLAKLHKHSSASFGLDYDNYIGSLKQSNKKHVSWTDFFICERLEPLVKMAVDHNRADNRMAIRFNHLYNQLDSLFPEEKPAFLHGDLWNGNYMISSAGYPCLIDPAIYYGHREMDIGMSKLFGGFSSAFYESYNREFPLEKEWTHRTDICNLYPLLVHLVLFGGHYFSEILTILRRYTG